MEKKFCTCISDERSIYCFLKNKNISIFASCNFSILWWVGGIQWFRIEMSMVQRDTEIRIALFLFYNRGLTSFSLSKNGEKRVCFEKNSTSIQVRDTELCMVSFQRGANHLREFGQNSRYVFSLISSS